MKAHCTAKELAGLPGMPGTEQNVNAKAKRENWPCQKRSGRGGGREYAVTALPLETRKALATLNTSVGIDHPAVRAAANQVAQIQLSAEEAEQQRMAARAESLATFNRLPSWQQTAAKAKAAIIAACNRYITTHELPKTDGENSFSHEYSLGRIVVAEWVRREIPHFHPGTLRSWIREEHELGMMGLVDCYGNRKGQSKIETCEPLKNALIALMTTTPHIKAKHAHEVALAMCPDAPRVSVKSVERFMTRWQADNAQVHTYITNPDAWKNQYMAAFGRVAESVTELNQRWEIDATPADLMLVDGRHKVLGITDVYSRRKMMVVSKTERAVDNCALLRLALMAWGVPDNLVIDNGSAYVADYTQAFLRDAQINPIVCTPFASEQKPFIERSFRVMSHDLVELLPGYIGHSVSDRKSIEARKSFASRIMQPDEIIEVNMTAAQLQTFLTRWCESQHNTVHSELNKTPNQMVAEWPHPVRMISDERALDVLLAQAPGDGGWRTVTKRKGIQVDTFEYHHSALSIYIGQRVQVKYDPNDMGRIIVYAPDLETDVLQFVCIAECPEITGISRQEVAQAAKQVQKQIAEEASRLKKLARRELKGRDIAELALSQREQNAPNLVNLPRQTVEYTTPGLTAAGLAAQALDGVMSSPSEHAPEIEAKRLTAIPEQPTDDAATVRNRKVVQLRPEEPAGFKVPDDRSDRWLLWNDIDQRIKNADEGLLDEEIRFYTSFRNSATWRAFDNIRATAH